MSHRNKKKIYSIILVNHGKQLETICSDTTEARIYKKFNELLKKNKEISFPIQYNNLKHVMVESKYELVIIKCKEFGDKEVNKIRDEYGQFVNYVSSNEDWIVIDRANYDVEETFWVYGYHPKLQRKTFDWIFDNMIYKNAKNKYMFKSIQIYLNKILIDCNEKLDIVICKNKKDAIRFYNQVEKLCIERKMKYVLLLGDIAHSKYKSDWIDRIQRLTHWSRSKVNRTSTRP
jgi:hypothetical protein